jgi:hypothetical protein
MKNTKRLFKLSKFGKELSDELYKEERTANEGLETLITTADSISVMFKEEMLSMTQLSIKKIKKLVIEEKESTLTKYIKKFIPEHKQPVNIERIGAVVKSIMDTHPNALSKNKIQLQIEELSK